MITLEKASNGWIVTIDYEKVVTQNGLEALWLLACSAGIECTIENGATKYTSKNNF